MASFIYDYLAAGFRIFPLWKIVNGECSCGQDDCKMAGKHPRVSKWQHVPNWSDEQIEVMEMTGQLDTGFGVVVDDHLVIDIDPRNGGDESYKRLCKDTGIDFEEESGFVVETGGGGLHIYFKNEPPVALLSHLDKYKGIDFKISGYVVGCGSLHRSGNYYEKKKGNPCDLTPIPPALLQLLKKPDHYRAVFNGESLDITEKEIADMLSHIDADADYDDWIKIGMAVHHSTNGDGYHLWNAWSSKGKKYNGSDELDRHWHSFGKSSNPVTIGTLFHMAEAGGYKRSLTFEVSEEQAKEVERHNRSDHPFSIDTVDLLRPPGFVGKVTTWINSQCLFPREHLAAAAAISTIGNIAGLRYTDDLSNVTANLFVFGVAASGTGKEAIMTAMMDLHIAAGVSAAVHGAIKSEQEIIRNLLRHQMAAYQIDELGIVLKKISNAGKSGASYLEGVIGTLMSAYGKANGYLTISGDLKEDIRSNLMKEIALCEDKISNNEDKEFFEARLPRAQRSLKELDKGIIAPFLSMFGATTPVTFDGMINFEQATNGFIGRAWIVREHETNPRKKKKFKKAPQDAYMNATLKQLYNQGTCNPDVQVCVEHRGDKIEVRTDKEAEDMLEQVSDWIEDYAEKHKGATGLESIVKRGYELCAKLSLILAIPSGLRTAEHVRWAYTAMRKDIDTKILLARSNMLAESERTDSLVDVLRTRIISACGYENGEPISVICQRATNKKYTKQDVQNMVVSMVDEGLLEQTEVEHAKTHVKSLRYVAV